jgi:murein DD-endopeptidase MepM/ murein hydrolase activator NlpD
VRPPISGQLTVTQLFGGNPNSEAYVNARGQRVIGHDGIDIACAVGTPVYPAWSGILTVIDDGSRGFGLHALVTDPARGRTALYGHLSAVDYQSGQQLAIHTPFASSGNTGYSTGPHVHFGIYHGQVDNGYGGASDPITDFDPDVWPLLDLSRTNL